MTEQPDPRIVDAPLLRVFVADDEPGPLAHLRAQLADQQRVEVVGEARDGEDAARKIRAVKPDLVFLDISMPGRDGLALARSLQEDVGPAVVFVTGHDAFAAEAFDIDAVDYILKPAQRERVRMALARARRRLFVQPRPDDRPIEIVTGPAPVEETEYATGLWVPKRQGLGRIEVSSIEWIEAARDYVILHTELKSYILRVTMEKLSRRLDPRVMVRISRSAFVRRDAVKNIERQSRGLIVVLDRGVALRAGTTFVTQIEQQFDRDAFRKV